MHLRRLLTVLVLALCAIGAFAGVARADGPVPTLASDRATYAPGDAVQLTGSGWLPGEPLHVHVADAGGHGWSFDDDLTASAEGSMSASVVLPSGFASDFVAVATSGLGGSATATFTSNAAPASTPTIVSDQNDYAPGSTVTLTGTDWLPNESVHLFVNDQDGQTWSYSADLSADSSGAFTHQFQLPNWFVANYTVVATGFSGSSATTAFTDSQPTAVNVAAPNDVSVVAGNAATFGNVSVTMGGNNSNCTVTLGATTATGDTGLPVGATANFGNSPVTGNSSFTSSLSVSTTAATTPGSYTFHIAAARGANCQGNGTTNSTQQLTLVVNSACTAPAITSQPSSQSITYGQNASFTAAASGTSPSVQWQVSTNGGSTFTNLSGETNAALSLTKPPVSFNGNQYRATFTNGCGTATSNAATLTVGAKNLTINGAVANNKVYDSTTSATVNFSGASLVGVESGDTVTINSSGYSASFANKTVGNGKPVTVTGVALGGSSAPNYTVSQPSGLTANITARDLTVTATGQNKAYDGTTSASVTLTTDKLSGDAVTASGTASFANKHVGTGKTVSVTGISISGADAGNYNLTNTTATTSADITKRPISVSAVADSKAYDGTTSSGGTPTISLGSLAPGDSAGFSQAFASKTVGSGKTLIPSGSVNDGNSGGNYDVTFVNSTNGVITAKNLTVTGAVANDKTYDGTASATVDFSGASLVGVVSGDSVSLDHSGYAATFASKTVGTNKPVMVTGVSLSGGDAGNYTVSQPSGLTADIGAKELSVSFQAQNKTYDGTTHATIKSSPAPSLVGVVSGDTVTLDGSAASAGFANKNVGTGKTVTASGFTKGGADAGNYVFATPQGTTTADISAKNLTVSGASANDKTYDGNDSATIDWSAASLVGVESGDSVSLDHTGYSAHFDNRNVGTDKPVTVSGVGLSGGDSGNYTVSQPSGLEADVTAKGLTITGALANDRTYDATDNATIDWTGANLVGVVSGDSVSIDHSAYSAHFNNKHVGIDKPVTVSGVGLGGSDAGNYTVGQPSGLKANVSQARLDIYAVSDSKTYDGTTGSSGTPTLGSGQVQGSDTVDGLSQAFQSRNVLGPGGSTLEVTGYSIHDGNAGANYDVHTHTASGTISAKNLTISGAVANDKTYDGTDNATINWSGASLNGVVSGDSVSIDHSAYTGHFDNRNVGTDKPVTVTGVSLGGTDGGNYSVSQPAGLKADVSPKNLTITGAVANSKTYDGNDSATIDWSAASLVGVESGDSVSIDHSTYSAHFDNKNVGTSKPVTVSGVTLSGGDAGNYTVSQPSGLTANISAKGLTINGAAANSKTYDGDASATVDWSGASLVGVVGGDDVSIDHSSYSASFNNRNVGSNKPVAVSGVTLSGGDAGNYSVSQPSGLTADITPKNLTISGAVANSKTYDGNASATIDWTGASLNGIVSGDSVAIDHSAYSASFNNKHVGTSKPVAVSGVGLSGADASNYTVSQPSGLTADIGAKGLTIAGAVANSKIYDGNADATVNWSGASLSGVVSGDSVSIEHSGYSASFNNRNVGTNKPVTVTGVTLSGADAGDYTVSQPTGLTANISAKGLTITGAVANSKTYDGNASATIDWTGASLNGVVTGDSVAIDHSGYSAGFANKNVGTNKPVTVSGVTLSGTDAGNYSVSQPSGLTATISARDLTVTATGQNKVYDGNTSAAATLATDKLAGDSVSAAYTSASFGTKHVGANKPVSVTGISISGADAGNYNLTNTSAAATADITARPITVTAVADTKVYDGTTGSAGAPTITLGSLASGDSGNFSQAFANKSVGTGKTLIPSGAVSDGNSGNNYNVTFVNNSHGVITAKNLTVAGITASNKPYDGNTSATINASGASLVGLVSGDAVTLNTGAATGAFTSSSPGTCTVQISGLTISGGDSGNYTLSQPVVTACIGAWYATGFYQPVGIPNSVWVPAPGVAPSVDPTTTVWNTAKGGSTIPLKFNLYSSQGGQERTSTADVRSFDLVKLACAAGGDEDAVDFATTGSTSLRYDGTAGQFIQNWKTPSSSSDSCYRVDVKFQDGSAIYAFFKLKK